MHDFISFYIRNISFIKSNEYEMSLMIPYIYNVKFMHIDYILNLNMKIKRFSSN
jgi:hypothetical protein